MKIFINQFRRFENPPVSAKFFTAHRSYILLMVWKVVSEAQLVDIFVNLSGLHNDIENLP